VVCALLYCGAPTNPIKKLSSTHPCSCALVARPADNIDNMAWHTKKYTFPAGVVTKDQKKAHGKAKSKADKKGTTKAQRKEQIRLRTIENARMSSKKKATDKHHACQHCHKKFRKQLDLQSHVKDRHGAYGKLPALPQEVPEAAGPAEPRQRPSRSLRHGAYGPQKTARTCCCAHGMQFLCRLHGPRGSNAQHDQTPALTAEKNGKSSLEETTSQSDAPAQIELPWRPGAYQQYEQHASSFGEEPRQRGQPGPGYAPSAQSSAVAGSYAGYSTRPDDRDFPPPWSASAFAADGPQKRP
jgi:hypothetical protein